MPMLMPIRIESVACDIICSMHTAATAIALDDSACYHLWRIEALPLCVGERNELYGPFGMISATLRQLSAS